MITPALKDLVLKDLVSKTPLMTYSGTLEKEAELYNISKEEYQAILNQFHKREFVSLRSFAGESFLLTIKAEAHDYVLAGGHVAEFEILDLQVEKLKTELYALEKTMGQQTFEKVKGVLDIVVAAWSGLLIKK